jgi:hypothetical protein
MATIHMSLLNEGVDVWRPVDATPMSQDTYRVDGEMPDTEEWAFPPGTVVRCELKTFSGGEAGLSAVEPARWRLLSTLSDVRREDFS